jgi:RNA polymerase sigma factor (sigma-70 family)
VAQQVPQARMLRGDEAQLFRNHELPLRAAVRHFAHVDEAIVDDACAHAWLQLMRCQPDRATAFAWLRTVAVREAWRLSKLERRDVRLDAMPSVHDSGRDAVVPSIDAREALRYLAALPHRQRRFLTLQIAGHSRTEIAAHTGATHRTVDRQLARARRHLRLVRDPD